MQERPSDLTDEQVADALRLDWGLEPAALAYAPVGFGDHHWTATDDAGGRWFVTVAELSEVRDLRRLRLAMDTAAALAEDAGLDFVVAPVRTDRGETVRRLDDLYAVVVYPQVDGAAGDFGDEPTQERRTALARLLGELHRATPKVPAAPVHDPAVAGVPVLHEALDDLARPWSGGPYAEPARAALAEHGQAKLLAVLAHYDELSARVQAAAEPVLTHGEPHPGNVLATTEGRLRLIDWDTLGLAPPERDLWFLEGGSGAEFAAYAEVTGHSPDPAALALYRLRWDLDDLTIYLRTFREPHGQGPDTELAWSGFTGSLERAVTAARPGVQ
ncbi:aminoglycoside phosphotransferase family protein [Streptomyces sp. A7024]|uniref:Aminoglycoside phosphotransferase family protein n=1 Tax=Streptomyces coryli TaxID=1128680 RepID=A0A6G4TXA8_9ACTN|nr:aminoglycoside phosphotransferase family protein [Streptomyces coryli]NGN64615.1 aminoglycoside phosphotransferase family protein [Streptomyces coryli]